MRFRDKIRVVPKIKKGTSRKNRRLLAQAAKLCEQIIDANKIPIEKAMRDALLYGTGVLETRWEE